MRLPTHGNDPPPQLPAASRGEEEALFALSRWDRLMVFGMLVAGAAVCFLVAFLFLPVLALRPRKFVTLWTVGSLLFISSFAALQGPVTYVKHLLSGPRLPFTACYFGSMALTLYFTISLRSSILTIVAAAVQMVALLWYLVSYFPMGKIASSISGDVPDITFSHPSRLLTLVPHQARPACASPAAS